MALLALTGAASAAFKDPGFLARPAGMGGAFIAVADDSNAVWYNPAGISKLHERSFLFTYSKPYLALDGVDMDMSMAAYLHPIDRHSSLSVLWSQFRTQELYRENIFQLGYGRDLGVVRAGINAKYLLSSVTTDPRTVDDVVFAGGTSRGALSFDLGLYKDLNDHFTASICVKDVTQPDVGYGSTERVPADYRAGISNLFEAHDLNGIVLSALDCSYRNNSFNISAGSELWLLRSTVAARIGGNLNEASVGGTYIFPLRSGHFIETHYSFTLPFRIIGSSGSHRLSIGVRY